MFAPMSGKQLLPAHLAFDMNTLSFLYSHDMKLLDIRSVPLKKLFCARLSPRTMSFLHDQARRRPCVFVLRTAAAAAAPMEMTLCAQVHRVADAMLDSAFLFIKQQGGEDEKVEAYCLSHPLWGPARCAAGAAPHEEDTRNSPVNTTTPGAKKYTMCRSAKQKGS